MLAKAALGGTVELNIDKLELASQRLDGRAALRWMQAGSALSRVNPLGDYSLDVSGTGSAATAQLRTLSGVLQVEGQGQWTAGKRFVIDGKARAADDATQLQPFLAMLGKMEGDTLPLHFEF
jgi:general secretion pathway protein N